MDTSEVDAIAVMADMLCQLAIEDPKWRFIELDTIVVADMQGLYTRYPQNPVELGDFNYWLNLQDKATRALKMPLIEPRKKMIRRDDFLPEQDSPTDDD